MIENWDQYKDLEYYPDRVCACSCGGRIKVGKHHRYVGIPKYIPGHAMKDPEVAQKVALALTGRKRLCIVGDKNPMKNSEVVKRNSLAQIGQKRPYMVGDKNPMKRPEVAIKFKGDKNPMKRPEVFAKHRRSLDTKPNKPEKFLIELLQELFPNQWKYIGDGKDEDSIIAGKNPDFVHVSQKKIIEFNGDYWHGPRITGRTKEEEEQQRIALFAKEGYQTSIIWEHELKDISKLIIRLLEFNED